MRTLYSSGLVFAPQKALIRGNFVRELSDWLSKGPKVEEYWSPEFRTLEGRGRWPFFWIHGRGNSHNQDPRRVGRRIFVQSQKWHWRDRGGASPYRFSWSQLQELEHSRTLLFWGLCIVFGEAHPWWDPTALIMLSWERDASNWQFDEKATDRTTSEWPLRDLCSLPVATSQTWTVLSKEADAGSWLFREKATDQIQSEWPLRDLCSFPVMGHDTEERDGYTLTGHGLVIFMCPPILRGSKTEPRRWVPRGPRHPWLMALPTTL
jgi:hypothetical protein